jgi:CheY-like chemotaxis protein
MTRGLPLAHVTLHARRTRRVLVIDDDQLVCRMLADAFTRRGFEAVTAPDGEAGLRRLIDELLALDLVVMDLVMPGIDGEELVHRVRHLGGEHDLAIVVASAHLTPEARDRLDAMGADAVIDKAVGPDRIAELAVMAHGDRVNR